MHHQIDNTIELVHVSITRLWTYSAGFRQYPGFVINFDYFILHICTCFYVLTKMRDDDTFTNFPRGRMR